jgi:hypothetical protein
MLAMRKLVGNAAAPASVLATVITFVTDVLQPLGNFAPWVAGISLLTAVVSGAVYFRHWRKPGVDRMEHPLLGVFVLSLGFAVFFGGWSWVEAHGPNRGYLAANVDPIAQVQAQLLGLQQDVTQIKQTTQQSATVVAVAATQQAQGQDTAQKSATGVAVAATAQAQGFKEIQDAFARLSSQGTLVPSPQTPQDWYANARLYQLKGDTADAIKSYEGYFTFKLEYVDPYLEYTALVRSTDGIARTRQAVDDLRRANPNSQALELLAATLLDAPADRLARLTALAARAPQFGPVFDELGQEYDRALQATVTNDLLQKQQDAYNALFKLEGQQGFSRYYIDKALADKHVETAHKMQAAYAAAGATFKQVDIQLYFFYNGVQFVIVLPEVFNAKQLLFGIDDPAPKTDAGHVGAGASSFVNTSLGPIPLALGDHTIYVQYVDANGVTSAISSKKFRVEPIAITFNPQPPDFSNNTVPGLFSLGVVGAQIAEQYRFDYSIDSDKLDKSLTSVAFAALSVTGLTRGDHTLYVRDTGADGKPTPVVKFPFTVK